MVAEKRAPHGRVNFFKYLTTETGIKTLEAASLRYSSPLLFNDAFDVQAGLHLAFTLEQAQEALFSRLVEYVQSETLPKFEFGEMPGAQLAREMWGRKATDGFPVARARDVLAPGFAFSVANLDRFRDGFRHHVWEDRVPRLRVLCLAEEPDNLLMWAHYSEDHKGVVLEFRVLPDQDNSLCAASRVTYHSTPPAFLTLDEFVARWFGLEDWVTPQFWTRYVNAKDARWSYEKEWRVWFPGTEAAPHFEDVPWKPTELAGVYLGCRMAAENRKRLLELVRTRYPRARVFQATRADGRYGLSFAVVPLDEST